MLYGSVFGGMEGVATPGMLLYKKCETIIHIQSTSKWNVNTVFKHIDLAIA